MSHVLMKLAGDRVALVSAHVFSSRPDALLELGEVLGTPGFRDDDAEYLVVDIDYASPVLMMRPRSAFDPGVAPESALDVPVAEAVLLAVDEPDDGELPPEDAGALALVDQLLLGEALAEEIAAQEETLQEELLEEALIEEALAEAELAEQAAAAEELADETLVEAEAAEVPTEESEDSEDAAAADASDEEVGFEDDVTPEDDVGRAAFDDELGHDEPAMSAEQAEEAVPELPAAQDEDAPVDAEEPPAQADVPDAASAVTVIHAQEGRLVVGSAFDVSTNDVVVADVDRLLSGDAEAVPSDDEQVQSDTELDAALVEVASLEVPEEDEEAVEPVSAAEQNSDASAASTPLAESEAGAGALDKRTDDALDEVDQALEELLAAVDMKAHSNGDEEHAEAVPPTHQSDEAPQVPGATGHRPDEWSEPVAAQAEEDAAEHGAEKINGATGEALRPDVPGFAAGTSDIDTFTCNDCVYVETCPNKDQREPAECGSFQWVTA